MYDKGVFNSTPFDIPLIAVGNLNMGGTGKSPMIEYLIKLLYKDFDLATLSRGYKRESTGFQLVLRNDTASKCGDEPLQFKNKFPDIKVAVDANRVEGVSKLRSMGVNLILLDDAFQHRKVQAGLYILLTSFNDRFTKDLVLPAGNLRESRAGAKRASAIVVTKCPETISEAEMEQVRNEISAYYNGPVFFSTIVYSNTVFNNEDALLLDDLDAQQFVLVTGIANPAPLVSYLDDRGINLEHYKFPDHHNFSKDEIGRLSKFSKILTTEKDYMRLKNTCLANKLYYLPIESRIIDDSTGFNQLILDYVYKK